MEKSSDWTRLIFDNTLKIIIILVVSFIFNTGISYFYSEKGNISIGNPLSIKNELYVPITIINYSSETINKLRFSTPKDISPQNIIVSQQVQINLENNIANSPTGKLILSELEPNQITTLMIPIKSISEASMCDILNKKELKLSVKKPYELENPIKKAFFNILIPTIIYIIIFSIFTYIVTRQEFNRLNKISELKEDVKKQDQKVHSIKNDVRKFEIMLIAKASDYAKELDFWKNTIRKMLYNEKDKFDIAEKLFKEVTNSLKTYGTLNHKDEHWFEHLRLLSEIISYKGEEKN